MPEFTIGDAYSSTEAFRPVDDEPAKPATRPAEEKPPMSRKELRRRHRMEALARAETEEL